MIFNRHYAALMTVDGGPLFKSLIGLLLLAGMTRATADESVNAPSVATIISAKPLVDTRGPGMNPGTNGWQEGWVQTSYVVRPDGTVGDPIVVDSTGTKEFEKAAIRELLKMRFTPATLNGAPIEQCGTEIRFLHKSPAGAAARPVFTNRYKQLNELIKHGDLDAADTGINGLLAERSLNIYESQRLSVLEAMISQKRGDKRMTVHHLKRSIIDPLRLEMPLYVALLKNLFTMQFSLGEYADALESYEILGSKDAVADSDEIKRAVADIEKLRAGSQPIAIPGLIEDQCACEMQRPRWDHKLLGRKFAFNKLEGHLDQFDLRCGNKRVQDDTSMDKTWEVPKEFGSCRLFVYGDKGARFTLLEYPQTATP